MAPYGDTGESDMDAPNMRPTSMPPKDTSPMPKDMKDNLDFGSGTVTPNDTLLLLGASSPYMNRNK